MRASSSPPRQELIDWLNRELDYKRQVLRTSKASGIRRPDLEHDMEMVAAIAEALAPSPGTQKDQKELLARVDSSSFANSPIATTAGTNEAAPSPAHTPGRKWTSIDDWVARRSVGTTEFGEGFNAGLAAAAEMWRAERERWAEQKDLNAQLREACRAMIAAQLTVDGDWAEALERAQALLDGHEVGR